MDTNWGDLPAPPSRQIAMNHEYRIKRESIAVVCLQGLLASRADADMRGYEGWREELCREAIRYADSLMSELEKAIV